MSDPMSLVLPTVGGSTDVWGTLINAALEQIAAHSHTSGKGVQVPSAGIGIDEDLSFGAFALTLAKAITFTEQAPAAMTGYSDALFVDSSTHDLFFRNQSGQNVQITDGNTLDLSLVGGIGGDYAAVSALFSYEDSTRRYLAQQEVSGGLRAWAGFATGDIDLYEKAASIANKVTLKSPSALAASYAWTFPAAVPASTQLVTVSAAGVMANDGVLGNNTDITLQGTGKVRRGARATTVVIDRVRWSNLSGGGVTSPTGIAQYGAGVPASSSNSFPIHIGDADNALGLITSVIVRCAVSVASCTFSLQTADTVVAGLSAVTGASGSIGSGSTITLTPSAPINVTSLANGGSLWLNVQPAATSVVNVYAAIVNTTIPS